MKHNIMNYEHQVEVDVDPACKIEYKHKYTDITGKERWSAKPLPPARVTEYLRAMGLRHNRDYMRVVNPKTGSHGILYGFRDPVDAMMLKLFITPREHAQTQAHFATCPSCGHNFKV